MHQHTHPSIVILGPTASGKSALGVKLAKKFHGVIISADSRQVYRGMDIGTGKITKREMDGVPHYLLSVASPHTQYSVARYVQEVARIIKTIPIQTPIFLVGGTPFYIDALTTPSAFSPVPPNLVLRRRLAKLSVARLIARLQALDPKRLKNIDRANRRRIERAIEIASSQTPSEGMSEPIAPHVLKIGLSLPRPELYRRIDERVDRRLKHGMLAEVARLHRQGLSWTRLDAFGLEYRYLSRYLRGAVTKQQAVQDLKIATHHFAKRQMTWWKRDRNIRWISTSSAAEKLIRTWLKK